MKCQNFLYTSFIAVYGVGAKMVDGTIDTTSTRE